ncbi:unnamed protein product [Musa acuminata subsp. malaccensis]|uniref:(wild Malaysian banana) hypothetical protein n=1 Tax=Musa acuminata subsp. malaccensis TaxID=214687 RepID=A0A804ISF7_MUSAM|nr:unnamed protein product [Musa acuminata subsp. malaccensis]
MWRLRDVRSEIIPTIIILHKYLILIPPNLKPKFYDNI